MMRLLVRIRACWKLARTVAHILAGVWTVHFVLPSLTVAEKQERIRLWALALLAKLAIKMEVIGRLPSHGPVLLVANHISWLDILVLLAARYCRFVSKADVHHWPVLGALAGAAGTLFIERASRRDAMRVVHHMAQALQDGDVVAIFPEGTTSDGRNLLPFHANLFQAAIAVDAPVLPVALRFVDAASGQPSLAPCYVGDDTLLGSLWRTLCSPPLSAVVTFGEPQSAHGRDRRTWAGDVRSAVANLRRSE